MSAAKQELKKVVGELSEDESRILLKFAEWLKDQGEELTDKELAILCRGEKQVFGRGNSYGGGTSKEHEKKTFQCLSSGS